MDAVLSVDVVDAVRLPPPSPGVCGAPTAKFQALVKISNQGTTFGSQPQQFQTERV